MPGVKGQRHLTDEDKRFIREKRGLTPPWTMQKIADALGCSRACVCKYAAGIQPKRRPHLTALEKELIKALYHALRLTQREIAAKLGLHQSCVWKVLNRVRKVVYYHDQARVQNLYRTGMWSQKALAAHVGLPISRIQKYTYGMMPSGDRPALRLQRETSRDAA